LVNATFDRQFGALPQDVEAKVPGAKALLEKAITFLLSCAALVHQNPLGMFTFSFVRRPEGCSPKSFLDFLRNDIDPTTGDLFTEKMVSSY